MPSQAPVTILNVDDVEVARYARTRVLQHAGFDVIEADTGQRALDMVETLSPALVLLDVRLPDIVGTTVCRLIKERWPATMVLQTSAHFVSAHDRTRGLDGGADGYLIQPIDPDELVAAVRALLRLHAAEKATRLLNDSLEERIRVRTAELREANVQLVQQMAQRERAEEALIHAQKLEAVGQLTGVIAHDFNNLLAGLMGYVQLIDRLSRDDSTRKLAKQALALVTRGSKLTGRLLNLARTRAAKLETVDVKALVEGMKGWLAQTLGAAFTLTITTSDEALLATTDANELEFAILNLAVNARDAMPRGGPVRIAVERRSAGAGRGAPEGLTGAHPGDEGSGDFVVISLADEGHGMPPEVASQAFHPFYSTKGPGQGTGLGLAQVQRLTEQSAGTVRIISSPDKGTVVEMWLKGSQSPAGGSVPGNQPTGKAEAPKPTEQIQVVLVDDEPDVLLTVGALLTSSGYQVRPFGSGRDALAHMRNNPADVLITDIAMPEISGVEVARLAREFAPAMALVFVTGSAEIDELEIVANGGILLRKPFSPAALTGAVTTSLLRLRGVG